MFMIKRIAIAIILIAILLVGAIIILPGLVPTDTYRDKLEAELSQTFARDVEISGDIKLSTFPVIKVETGGVTLSNPKGFSDNNFVDVRGMSAKVKLWPLFRKQVEISGITLNSPTIRLEKKSSGEVNWTLNDGAEESPETKESEPYKRDGRFTEYDPSLALLQMSDGKVIYSDAVSGQTTTLEDINLALKAPNLRSPLSLNGDLIFDGLETNLSAELQSPFDFLSGNATSFEAKIETGEGQIDATGQFLKSQDIAFDASYTSSSDEPLALAKRLPLPENLEIPAFSRLSAKGDISYGPNVAKLPKLDLTAEGVGLNVSYIGSLDASKDLTANGRFTAQLDDMSVIAPYLEEPVEALNAVSSVSAEGNVARIGKQLSLTNIQSVVSGPDLKASFTGDASYNESLSLTGTIDAETDDLPAVIQRAGLSQPDSAALKRITAKGQLTFVNGEAQVSNLTADASDGLLNGQYSGDFSYGETIGLNGQFTGEISDLGALDAALSREIPYSDVAKRITLSSQIETTASGFSLSGVTAALDDGLLNGDFRGQLAIGDKSDISGTLTLKAESLRAIAMTQDVDVPPSTPTGAIFENFRLSGQVSGTPEMINFNNGALGLDKISTSGDFVLNMTRAKPLLTGRLDMAALDLRPYMAAWSEQKPEGVILPWSTTPINLGGLEAVDAEIDFNAPEITLDRLKLGATEGRVDLKNALLSTNLSKSELYGGLVNGSLSISGASRVPKISIKADVDSVAAQTFLSAASGFDKVAGTANLSISLDGQGISQEAIMKSLTGTGSFKVLDGKLLGINADELISGLDAALTSRKIPQGLGLGKTTNFNDLIGSFSITDGRASIGDFKLQSGAVFIDAAGLIDIGDQRLDFGIRPKLSEGSDLATFGIPLKFSGGFGEAKAGLDTDVLADIAKAKAREKAASLVQDRVGGTVGGILGNVIGGNENTSPGGATETSAPTPDISNIIKLPGILGGGDTSAESNDQAPTVEISPTAEPTTPESTALTPKTPQPPAEEAVKPEEAIENALKDLFGRKKKDNTGE